MEVTVSAIHCTIPESLHDHAARHAQRLDRFEPRNASMAMRFENPNGMRNVEVKLSVAGGPPMLAQATGATYRAAMNEAVDRIERQLKRRRARVRQNRRGVPVRD